MPDSSDNVNARDGASIVWGPEIRVDGKRPEWLRDDEVCALVLHGQLLDGCGELTAADWQWGGGHEFIRLPADHPHYSKPATTPELDPALWDRMEALVREMAAENWAERDSITSQYAEARAIVADLPKPVDPDEQWARDFLPVRGWAPGEEINQEAAVMMLTEAVRHGRAQERKAAQ